MTDIKYIEITIKGPVQSGKSAVLASLRSFLEEHGYCVAIPAREERFNPSTPLYSAATHEKPNQDTTVFVLVEATLAGNTGGKE